MVLGNVGNGPILCPKQIEDTFRESPGYLYIYRECTEITGYRVQPSKFKLPKIDCT
jgi:hypothetical protein